MKFHILTITNTATEKMLEVTAVKFKVEDYVLCNVVFKKSNSNDRNKSPQLKFYAKTTAWFFSIEVSHTHVQNECDYCEKAYILLQQLNHLVNVSTLQEPNEPCAILTALACEITHNAQHN
jgi:hypothetical protein